MKKFNPVRVFECLKCGEYHLGNEDDYSCDTVLTRSTENQFPLLSVSDKEKILGWVYITDAGNLSLKVEYGIGFTNSICIRNSQGELVKDLDVVAYISEFLCAHTAPLTGYKEEADKIAEVEVNATVDRDVCVIDHSQDRVLNINKEYPDYADVVDTIGTDSTFDGFKGYIYLTPQDDVVTVFFDQSIPDTLSIIGDDHVSKIAIPHFIEISDIINKRAVEILMREQRLPIDHKEEAEPDLPKEFFERLKTNVDTEFGYDETATYDQDYVRLIGSSGFREVLSNTSIKVSTYSNGLDWIASDAYDDKLLSTMLGVYEGGYETYGYQGY